MTKRRNLEEGALLSFTPRSYWGASDVGLGGQTNEFERRLEHALTSGDWRNVKLPSVKFGLHGGNYLPGFRKYEVEITRGIRRFDSRRD